jgi:hypothetical protein
MPVNIPTTHHLPPTTYRPTQISRRTFFGAATGAVATILRLRTANGPRVVSGPSQPDCVLLDAREYAVLPESLAGYESALAAAGVRFFRTSVGPLPYSKTIIVPACLALLPELTQEVAEALKRGSHVLLESGAGFATRPEFAQHQGWLRNNWGVRVEAPVDLWTATDEQLGDWRPQAQVARGHRAVATRAPYVDFHWPFRTMVRDFSLVVPVCALPGHVVASCGQWPVASKRALGKGTLVFLGSPLGPHLLAGDAEAHRWLQAVLSC